MRTFREESQSVFYPPLRQPRSPPEGSLKPDRNPAPPLPLTQPRFPVSSFSLTAPGARARRAVPARAVAPPLPGQEGGIIDLTCDSPPLSDSENTSP